MNANAVVYEYHDRTKHRLNRYARSLGYMDWATQPDPFRNYTGARSLTLPLALENPTPPYHLLNNPAALPNAPLQRESLSQLLQFSLGLAAWKRFGAERWALRCNASSGNLHPTEAYLLLPPIPGISTQSSICHYTPKTHGLEVLAEFDTPFWEGLPEGSIIVGLSSVLWREVWKYGERAWRYCQLDAGHAWQALAVSANALGWHCRRLREHEANAPEQLFGLDQTERFIEEERESADMLLLISPLQDADEPDLKPLIDHLSRPFTGKANRLSPTHHYWEVIDLIDRATHAAPSRLSTALSAEASPVKPPSASMGEIVLRRRSAQVMDPLRAAIAKEAFLRMLHSVTPSLDGTSPAADLVLFVHSVEEMQPGLYLLLRNPDHLTALQENMHAAFVFEEIAHRLYLLKAGNFRFDAKHISCNQEIAKDSAFSLGMLCEFDTQIDRHGPQRYRELYHECGAIGQQLYLEATSLGLSATGIGCFLDDMLHELLGLKDTAFQSLYHFTVGRSVVDTRLTTEPPYTRT